MELHTMEILSFHSNGSLAINVKFKSSKVSLFQNKLQKKLLYKAIKIFDKVICKLLKTILSNFIIIIILKSKCLNKRLNVVRV